MEDPADICKTGVPMSEKGNFDHNKNGFEGRETSSPVSVFKLEDHDYPSCSFNALRDPPCDNDAYINNSLQDGFQSEIFSNLVEAAGLPSELCDPENVSVEMGAVSQSDSHIHFTDSPGTSFSCKMEPFSPMDGLVSSLDEQLDSYLLNGFKDNNSQSTDGSQSVEEQQRNVSEAICDIAKSFGLEDLLPETFIVDGAKNLCVNITTSVLSDENENIGELSLEDFDRCSELNSPVNLETIAENYDLNDLDASSHPKAELDSVAREKPDSDPDPDVLMNSSESDLSESLNNSFHCEGGDSEAKNFESVENVSQPNQQSEPEHIGEEILYDVSDQVNNIPTVSISDAEIGVSEGSHPAGTVLITTDKASKKMQIVLTLEQGQQVYDIDTDSVDVNNQAIDLDLSTSVSVEKVPDQSLECEIVDDDVFVTADEDENIDKSQEENQDAVAARIAELVNIPPKMKMIKMWVCPVLGCGQILDKECKLRVHMISHKGVRPFKCSFDGCDWAFTTPYRLRRHEETHLGCKDFICDFEGCNRKFTTVYNLKTHKKRHKWPNSLSCPSKYCDMSFSNRRKLELHLRVHKDVEAPYKCTICGKQYYSANCIASHYRTHQYNEDDFKCPFGCGKVYDKICRLRQHIRHHTGDRPYTCPAEGCKWSFMSASKLTRHMRKHTGERKFVCTEPGCGKSFMRPEHLKGHLVIHSGDKPFHCPHENCNAKFTAKSSLYVHVKKHCPSVLKVVYHCPAESCIKKYNSKATLKQHVQKCHPEFLKDGKLVNIEEKLELTMPVSVVNQTEGNLELSVESNMMGKNQAGDNFEFTDLEEIIADDPAVQVDTENYNLSDVSSVCASTSGASMPKVTVTETPPRKRKISRSKKGTKPLRVSQINKSGCARTDYCAKRKPKKAEPPPSFIYLNPNSSDNDARNYLLHNQLPTDIKSPDIMLASSIINHENPSDQFLKSHFSSDNSSMSHSLYADESLLVSTGEFGSELMPVSLLSDGVDSDESVLNSDPSGIVFSDQNTVDAFSEHLHGLD